MHWFVCPSEARLHAAPRVIILIGYEQLHLLVGAWHRLPGLSLAVGGAPLLAFYWLLRERGSGASSNRPPVLERVNKHSLFHHWSDSGIGVCLRARVCVSVCVCRRRDKERESEREREQRNFSPSSLPVSPLLATPSSPPGLPPSPRTPRTLLPISPFDSPDISVRLSR